MQQQQQQQQLSLFSDECIALLRQALEHATATAAAAAQKQQTFASSSTIVYPKGYKHPRDDDHASLSSSSSVEGEEAAERKEDEGEESSSSSSESEKEENGDDDDDRNTNEEEDSKVEGLPALLVEESSEEALSSNATIRAKRRVSNNNKLPAMTMDKRQRDAQVRKHVESLVCTRLPLSSPEQQKEEEENHQQQQQQQQQFELRLPSALLSKEFRRSDNSLVVEQARYFLSLAENSKQHAAAPWVVLFLRSGRFSGAIFQAGVCIQHKNLQRYTVRKGQGKAQSMQDASGRRPKSIGSQLRRAGEESLKQDIAETLLSWKGEIDKAALVLISCPKTMRKSLYDCMEPVMARNDDRIRRVPLDLGKPTFENTVIIHDVLSTVTVAQCATTSDVTATEQESENQSSETAQPRDTAAVSVTPPLVKQEKVVEIPLTPLHEAAKNGDLAAIQDLLEAAEEEKATDDDDDGCAMVDRVAGKDLMTALHFAAGSTTGGALSSDDQHSSTNDVVDAEVAAACVTELLVGGKANPAKLDGRSRPPYFLASHEKVREAFRMARAVLGEDYCKWDEEAKVGPPLTLEDVNARKEKEAEKKKKKRQRQKEKKAQEKAQKEEAEKRRQEEEETQKQQEEAKRVRDGLAPKMAIGCNVCDFCQTVCKGRQRSKMFKRLDYNYCTTECLQKHKRELMAAAALSRFES